MTIKKTTLILALATALCCLHACSKKTSIDKSEFSRPDLAYLAKAPFTANHLLTIPDVNGFAHIPDSDRVVRPTLSDTLPSSPISDYLEYNFVGLAKSSFGNNDDIINVEISEFLMPDDAYGFFSKIRPNGIRVEAIGTESYILNDKRYVVHGHFVMILSSETVDEPTAQAMIDLAIEIDSEIDEIASISPYYLLFPYRDKIQPSTKYISFNFMNIGSLNSVHTTDYIVGDDSLTLFMTVDPESKNFERLKAFAQQTKQVEKVPTGFSFVEGEAIMFIHPQYGRVLAGRASEKLVGIIGFNPEKQLKMARLWVWGLQQ